MELSWQTSFALACAAVFAAIVPGTLGYATARVEGADRQRQEVVRLRAELHAARGAVRQVDTACRLDPADDESSRAGAAPAGGASRLGGLPMPHGAERRAPSAAHWDGTALVRAANTVGWVVSPWWPAASAPGTRAERFPRP
ncbi:hypothetical protein [Sphaerisporangium sp. TRM90804]|uniref:hypothetical protein n=1 Tax=Sphaerisporangium sp. TRM90804 TaxID=3031113 RepID=UPI00244C4586|nr:hypothetical protein [Sphaerisporangium sp. TRM90804]MDH2426759.1 hypothetical protein [Sphaerisporangium sp. TRM90804]